MKCPLCGYLMEPFDPQCRRCQGQGLPQPAPAPIAPPLVAPPQPVAVPAPLPVTNLPAPPYFFAAFERDFAAPKLFHVYPDEEALLFIFAGPFHNTMIEGLKRFRAQHSNDAAQRAQWIGQGIAVQTAINGLAGGGLVIVGAGLDALAAKNLANQRAKREAIVNAMGLDQLRLEASTTKTSFRVAPDTAKDVHLRPISTTFFSNDQTNIAGYLRFAHRKTGKWKLKLICEADAQDAVREFRRVFGAQGFSNEFPF